jgi:hypothetical protein
MKKLLLILAVSYGFSSTAIADASKVMESYGNIPLAFTLNQGQTDSQVKFTTVGNGCSMFFAPNGTTFLLSRETSQSAAKRAAKKTAGTHDEMTPAQNTGPEYESFAVKTVFVGANQNPAVVGEDRLAWNNNYFVGNNPSKWRTDVPNYGKIRLKEVYSGIDLVYYGNKNRIKYDLVVKPGEDPSKIVLRYDLGANGGNALSINGNGELVVKTPLGDIIERKPYCYQKIDRKEVEVSIAYRIIDVSLNTFGFGIGAFNAGFDLYIDPELVYSTYIGGRTQEFGDKMGLAVDSSGNTYFAGITDSIDFPVTSGSIDGNLIGSWNGFVSKLNPSGTALIYSTVIGGGGDDCLSAIAIDSERKAYVTGWSTSTDYPATHGETLKGREDITLVKLNASGNALEYATMFGGSQREDSWGIALDSSGHAFVTGRTWSNDFPVTNGAFDQSENGNVDGFVVKLTSSGDSFIYSTYLGGSLNEALYDIRVDNDGNAYVVGDSSSNDYPTTTGAFDRTQNGNNDVIISKLNPAGSELVYSTYVGGSGNDSACFMTLDSEGKVYYSGHTNSTNYPTTSNAYDMSYNGNYDAIVGILDAAGSNLFYSTFVGGSGNDHGAGIAFNTHGIVNMAGLTYSLNFPTTSDALEGSNNGSGDGFVIQLNPESPGGLVFSTYIGGSGYDQCLVMAVDSNGFMYISGVTTSSDFPTTPFAFDRSYSNMYEATYDGFILKIGPSGQIPSTPLTVASAAAAGLINRYAYVFDGTDYNIIDPEDTSTFIQPWQGFWASASENVDLLIPRSPSPPSVPTDTGLDLRMVPNKWYLISAPLNPTNPELSSVFSSLGTAESTWRAVKWDYTYTGSSDIDGYKVYTGPGTLLPMIPGRGYWVKQINSDTRAVRITGAPVIPSGEYYELQLPANGIGMTSHMVGNPYWYAIRWKDMLVRKPSMGKAPVGKLAATPVNVEKWFVGIKLEALDGTSRDMYNRAGVVTTTGADSKLFNALDMLPPDSFVNVNLKDPDTSGGSLAYDFRPAGKDAYTWEITLSTSYRSISSKLTLDNIQNLPKGVSLMLKDTETGKYFEVNGNQSFPVNLSSDKTHKYILTAEMGPGTETNVGKTQPVTFGIGSIAPNPFNPSTNIRFGLEKTGTVTLKVYNINGQRVDTLIAGTMSPGTHSVVWNARGMSTGVYLIVLETYGKKDSRKISLIK